MRKQKEAKTFKRIVRSTQTRPLRGAKNREQGCSSATADFLLEAEKRGSPPKSEKRQLLARRGSGAGVQPFCEKNQVKLVVREAQNLQYKILDSAFMLKFHKNNFKANKK